MEMITVPVDSLLGLSAAAADQYDLLVEDGFGDGPLAERLREAAKDCGVWDLWIDTGTESHEPFHRSRFTRTETPHGVVWAV